MRKSLFFAACVLACASGTTPAQTTQGTPARPAPTPAQQQPTPRPAAQRPAPASFDITDYGVRIEPEPRLLVMMAALDAAGWDPTPEGSEPSVFRREVRKDLAALDPALRQRLRDFFERYKPAARRAPNGQMIPPTPAEQAAPYVSLAYLLGPAPTFEAPARTEDLPAGVLDVIDFAPLLREFYRQTGMAERMPAYLRAHNAEGDRLRRPTAEMLRDVLSYLHTRPQLTITEVTRAPAPAPGDKKKPQPRPSVREKDRRFLIVPDLLAAPGAINFRVIGDDYYAIAPAGTEPASSELRRAYVQYVIDPLILRYGREVSAKRAAIKTLLDEQRRFNPDVTPDAFLALARSLVVAADVRSEETARMLALQGEAAARLREAKDEAARAQVTKDVQARRQRIEDEAVARLAEAYERGAVLSFHFADQLRGLETSGFDLSNFFADMINAIDATREAKRLEESAEAVRRNREARALARKEAEERAAREPVPASSRPEPLVRGLKEADELLSLNDHEGAEARLRALQKEFPAEPRVYFGLARVASRAAETAFDPELQEQRLRLALDLYQQSITAATPDADAAVISRAHVASGRILAHLERPEEAAKEFDAAIQLGDVRGGAFAEARAERQKLPPQP